MQVRYLIYAQPGTEMFEMYTPWSHCITSITPQVFQPEGSFECVNVLQAKSDGLMKATPLNGLKQPSTACQGRLGSTHILSVSRMDSYAQL